MPFLAAIPAAVYAGIAAVGTVVGVAGSLIGASQQAAAMQAQADAARQQAVQAQQIANYNAEMQRQNAMVSYQMAQYQAQTNQQLMLFNQAAAINNANLAMVQAEGAQQQYQMGLENAKQKEIEAQSVRENGMEEQRRARQENALRIGALRTKMGASGVTFEGSNLETLADAANIGETAVQDMVYATELESRKTLREGELEKWKAGFSLLDKYGYDVQAMNAKNEAAMYDFRADTYGYESALSGAKYQIDLNQARLTELSGAAQSSALNFQASQYSYKANSAMVGGAFGAASSLLSGASSLGSFYTPRSSTPNLTVGAYTSNSGPVFTGRF